MKFYKRDPDRALSGMAELSLKQRGAYNSLLDLLYSRDGNVPDDDKRVARMMSCHWREWASVKRQLIDLGKVWVEDGCLCAKRVQETIKEAADFSQEQSRRASKGWQKRKNVNENNNNEMPPGNALTPTPTPTPKKERAPNGAPKKGTRFKGSVPDDWIAEAEAKRPDVDARLEAQKFENHWKAKAGQGATKLDWRRTWDNWILNAKPAIRAGPSIDYTRIDRNLAEKDRRRENIN